MKFKDNKKIELIMKMRGMGITNMDVLAAMEKVPRELFVPTEMQDQAYEDTALPIGRGQTISQPYIVAAMTQGLEPTKRDTILEIGTGSGYQTCILAHLCRRVYSIERHKPLLDRAEQMFEHLRLRNITAIAADGMEGWPTPRNGPHKGEPMSFDKIICTAAAGGKPPPALLEQLRVGGIFVIPVAVGERQILRRYKKEGEDTFAVKDLMDVRFVPLLPRVAPLQENAEDNPGYKAKVQERL